MSSLVVDANMAVAVASADESFASLFPGATIIVPWLFHVEVRSALHRAAHMRVLDPADARMLVERVSAWGVESEDPRGHGARVWAIADGLGWAKTYDAEYLAIAQAAGCPIASLDRRVIAAAKRLGIEVAQPAA
jgi:predicted nucleic acid-binding protein